MSRDTNRSSRREKKGNRGLIRGILLCAAGILVLTAGVLVYHGVIHREGPQLNAVTGLQGQACYHDLSIAWEPVKKADGYIIFMSEEEGDASAFERIAELEGPDNCSFELDDYTHDMPYWFRVAAYGTNKLTKERSEGEPSQPVEVKYDSSLYAQKLPVLTYHEMIPEGYEVKSSLTVREDMFRQQMQYLKDNDFRTLSMDEFYQWHEGKLEVPKKSCVITFDDGADNIYYLAYPILREMGLKSTIFCIGHHLEGTTGPFTPEEGTGKRFGADVIEKVRAEYPDFAFESHTYNMHARINGQKPVNVLTYDEIMEDFRKNSAYGFHYMAYPWGTSSEDMRKAAKDSGIRLGFNYGPFRYATRDDDPYQIRRIKVGGTADLDSFIQTVEGERPDDPLE